MLFVLNILYQKFTSNYQNYGAVSFKYNSIICVGASISLRANMSSIIFNYFSSKCECLTSPDGKIYKRTEKIVKLF